MKLGGLPRIPPPPPPPEPVVCVACRTMRAECEAPVGEGTAPMCWVCAHHVVQHGATLEEALEYECDCSPWEIYPDDVLELRGLKAEALLAAGQPPLG